MQRFGQFVDAPGYCADMLGDDAETGIIRTGSFDRRVNPENLCHLRDSPDLLDARGSD